MSVKPAKPTVLKYYDSDWEFTYPSSIDNQKVHTEFWDAVELLDC